ncbi:MAG: hypothetical protein R3B95_18695, partial [Nitrospirales bacterium]|nr:hypothetical protein [Nitrospirales bacterium]
FRPGSQGSFVSAKEPKTIVAPSGLIRIGGRWFLEGGPTRDVQTGPAGLLGRPPMGPVGRRRLG